jgi:hypothetical protein
MPIKIPETKSDKALREIEVEINGERVMDVDMFVEYLRLRIAELEGDIDHYRTSLIIMLALANTPEIRAQQQKVNEFRAKPSKGATKSKR